MANKGDLLNRKGVWYFNKAYPKPLWTITGKSPFRLSLRTTSLRDAERAKPAAERLYWAAVDAAQVQLGPKQPRQFTELEAVGLVAQWFKNEDAERMEAVAEAHSPLMDIDASLRELDGQDAETRQAIAEGDLNTVLPLAKRLASEAGLEFDPKAKAAKSFMLALLRGRRELLMLERARVLGDYTATPSDPVIQKALEGVPRTTKVRTVGDLIDGFKGDSVGGWSPATVKAVEAPFHVLREFFGASKDVSTITREDGRALFVLVQNIPTNMTKLKALRGLSLSEAVAKAGDLGLATLSPKTINETYLAFIGSAFRWGVSEGWISFNPLERLSVVETVDDADKRDPFTVAQLNILFHWDRGRGHEGRVKVTRCAIGDRLLHCFRVCGEGR